MPPVLINRARLLAVLRILNRHRTDISRFYNSLLHIQAPSTGLKGFRETFRASVNERRGASHDRGQEAIERFEASAKHLYSTVIELEHESPELSYKRLFEELVLIPNINQKIAGMFCKFLVVYKGYWPSMLPYLYVPLDRVVLKMLGETLEIYEGLWTQAPSIIAANGNLYIHDGRDPCANYRAFTDFQSNLLEVSAVAHTTRILNDELWFIGTAFCKEFPLCQQCWLNKICPQIH